LIFSFFVDFSAGFVALVWLVPGSLLIGVILFNLGILLEDDLKRGNGALLASRSNVLGALSLLGLS
jgi:hypothetical protein